MVKNIIKKLTNMQPVQNSRFGNMSVNKTEKYNTQFIFLLQFISSCLPYL